jgi:cytochrome c oxidase accessory protein FixG
MGTREVAPPPEATSDQRHPGISLIPAEEHVLPTLESDGSRRWLHPRLATGSYWKWRRLVAYLLVAFFTILPHLRWDGKPLVLIDLPARKFHLLGATFLPTDTVLLALLMVSLFLAIFLITALFGRLWCGWGCPQTVYMEFFFRPIDRFFQGTAGKGGKPSQRLAGWRWWARLAVYVALCMFLAHTFLAYFVGTDRLAQWVRQSPLEHPKPFLVMALTTGLMLFDFLFFREQLCLIACPYGRFQSVLLDRRSLIVSYDRVRGEPRGHGKRVGERSTRSHGDCVDCGMCVQVCPTGIDIRNGLQMECIHCTQCIDACNSVMSRLHMPKGLIRYGNQDEIDRKPAGWLRPRVILYPLVLAAALAGFGYLLTHQKDFDARIYRNLGNSFSVSSDGWIDNSLRLSLTNRTDQTRSYRLTIQQPAEGRVQLIESGEVVLAGGEIRWVPILVSAPFEAFSEGNCQAMLTIEDDHGQARTLPQPLLGPFQKPKPLADTPVGDTPVGDTAVGERVLGERVLGDHAP